MKGKAAEIKDLGPVMVLLWQKYYNEKRSIDRKILTVLEGSAHLDDILASHPSDWVLDDKHADDLFGTACIMYSTWYHTTPHHATPCHTTPHHTTTHTSETHSNTTP